MAHARSARPLRANDVRISSLSGTLILLGLLGSAGPGLASQGAPQPSRRTAPESNDGAARLLSTAHGLLGRGLHDLAAAEYERFLADWPGHDSATTARYGLAVCLHRMERYEAALGHLDPLGGIAGFPYAPEVALLTGACRLALGSNREAAAALRAFQRSHAGHASAPDAAAMLVEALWRGGEHEQAAREARSFAQSRPDHALRERTDVFLALAEMRANRHERAQTVLEESIARFPRGALADQATVLLGQCRQHRGLLREAQEAYAAVVARAGGSLAADAMLGLGQIALAQERLDEAAGVLDRLLREHPDAPSAPGARLARARVALSQGSVGPARAELEELERSGPENLRDDAAYWLAKCDLREGRPEAAAERLAAALAAHTESELVAEMAFDLSVSLLRAGRVDEGGEALGRFRDAYPQHPLAADALATMAGVAHAQGRWAESLSLCERYLRDSPGSERALEVEFLAAENRSMSGDYARAEEAYRRIARRLAAPGRVGGHGAGPSPEAVRFRLAMSVYRQGRAPEAEALLGDVVGQGQVEPRYAPALLALGDLLFQRGAWSEAESALSRALEAAPDGPGADDALIKQGLSRARRGDHDGAIAVFERLERSHPGSVHAGQSVFERGQCLLALGRDDEARRAFEGALSREDAARFAPHALMGLGTIARRQGRADDAADLLDRAARLEAGEVSQEAALRRAESLLDGGRDAQAAEALSAFLGTNPSHPRADAARGRLVIALSRAGDHEGALAQHATLGRRASGLDAATRRAMLYEVAWSQRSAGRAADAERTLRSLLDDGPEDGLRAHGLLALGSLRLEGGDAEGGAGLLGEALEAAVRAGDEVVVEQASYRLGACRLEREEFDAAATALEPFETRWGSSVLRSSALLLRGEALLRGGRAAQASATLRRVVDEHGESEHAGPALLRLGEAAAALQHWSRSEEAFAEFLRREPESGLWFQARFGLGWARENQGRLDEAMREYRAVADGHRGATAARAQFQIGQCLFALERHADAVRELLKVDILHDYPEWSAAALYEAGRCLAAAGRAAEAREQFDAVRTRFAGSSWARLASERLAEVSVDRTPGR